MRCPKCNHPDTRVIDSRLGKNGYSIRRRRACSSCDYRFSTTEEILREGLVVVKRDGRREDFDPLKIRQGLSRACEKRPVSAEQLDLLVSDVLAELEAAFEGEIPSEAIGERIMVRLRQIDPIAYVRFASVYKDFRDISELEAEISTLRTPKP